ncbi:hypothetical protein RI367_004537 [Sorochytrium milnesiophthora]
MIPLTTLLAIAAALLPFTTAATTMLSLAEAPLKDWTEITARIDLPVVGNQSSDATYAGLQYTNANYAQFWAGIRKEGAAWGLGCSHTTNDSSQWTEIKGDATGIEFDAMVNGAVVKLVPTRVNDTVTTIDVWGIVTNTTQPAAPEGGRGRLAEFARRTGQTKGNTNEVKLHLCTVSVETDAESPALAAGFGDVSDARGSTEAKFSISSAGEPLVWGHHVPVNDLNVRYDFNNEGNGVLRLRHTRPKGSTIGNDPSDWQDDGSTNDLHSGDSFKLRKGDMLPFIRIGNSEVKVMDYEDGLVEVQTHAQNGVDTSIVVPKGETLFESLGSGKMVVVTNNAHHDDVTEVNYSDNPLDSKDEDTTDDEKYA